MIPAGITDKVVEELSALMEEGDIIINGGNSNYREDYDRAAALKKNQNIDYLDCGTSGGVFGLDRGYCLMIGGDEKAFAHCEPLFASIAAGLGDIERTPGRSGDPAPEEQGYLLCGGAGSGHFVKMVHNGIEYGMMAAYAEGLNVLHKANSGNKRTDPLGRGDPARAAAVLPVRPRSGQGGRGLAPRLGHLVVAARPDRRRVAG